MITKLMAVLATVAALRILLDVAGIGLVIAAIAVLFGLGMALLGAGLALLALNAVYGREEPR